MAEEDMKFASKSANKKVEVPAQAGAKIGPNSKAMPHSKKGKKK